LSSGGIIGYIDTGIFICVGIYEPEKSIGVSLPLVIKIGGANDGTDL
jgi:hypothetical protein